jgi:hypothetical protein
MSVFPPPTTGPAGWYPDPSGGRLPRYFDGRSWADPEVALAAHRPPHPTLPLASAVGAIATLVVSLIGGRLLIDALASRDWPIVVYVAILATVGYGPSLVWCRYVSRRWGTGHLGDDVGLRFRWSDLGWGPVIWFGAVVSQVLVAVVVLLVDLPTSSNTEGVSDLQADRGYVISLLVTAVIAAPFVEEIVFRGVVMRGLLSRLPVVPTVLLQGVLFGLAHIDPVRGSGNLGLVVILSGVGVAFGVAAFLLRRVGPTIVAHAIFNAVVLTIVLTGFVAWLEEQTESDAVAAPVAAAGADSTCVGSEASC